MLLYDCPVRYFVIYFIKEHNVFMPFFDFKLRFAYDDHRQRRSAAFVKHGDHCRGVVCLAGDDRR